MLRLIPLLLCAIAGDASYRSTNSTSDAIADALAKIVELPARLLRLALGVLLLTLVLQALHAECAADGLLARADGLVPGAGLTVGVVLGDARSGDRDWTDGGAGFGEVIFGCGFGFLVFGLRLWYC